MIDTQSLKAQLSRRYRELEARLADEDKPAEEEREPPSGGRPHREINDRFVSTTDPDAAIVRQGKPKLYYKTHRSVDASSEVITAATITPGDVNEAHLLISLVKAHRENTQRSAEVVVADSKYGTIENFLA